MCAAEFTIWSSASREKFTVMSSTTGRSPGMAAPTPMPDDRVLRDRGVAHAPVAELLQQAVGDLEGAVEHADVLAHEEHVLVALHLLAQRLVERLAVAHDRHRRRSSAASARHLGSPASSAVALPSTRPARARPRRGARRPSARRPSTSRAPGRRGRRCRRRATPAPGTATGRRTPPPRRRVPGPPRRPARRAVLDQASASIRRWPKAMIGSRLRHSATCSLVRYSSGSAIEWPRNR